MNWGNSDSKVLIGEFRLELLSRIHLLEAPVLVFELFYAQHHGGVYATELGPPPVKGGGADAQLPATLWHWQASFNAFERSHDLAVRKS